MEIALKIGEGEKDRGEKGGEGARLGTQSWNDKYNNERENTAPVTYCDDCCQCRDQDTHPINGTEMGNGDGRERKDTRRGRRHDILHVTKSRCNEHFATFTYRLSY